MTYPAYCANTRSNVEFVIHRHVGALSLTTVNVLLPVHPGQHVPGGSGDFPEIEKQNVTWQVWRHIRNTFHGLPICFDQWRLNQINSAQLISLGQHPIFQRCQCFCRIVSMKMNTVDSDTGKVDAMSRCMCRTNRWFHWFSCWPKADVRSYWHRPITVSSGHNGHHIFTEHSQCC